MFDSQSYVLYAVHIDSIAVIHRREAFTCHNIPKITNQGIEYLNTFGAQKGAVYVKMIETINAEKLQNVLIFSSSLVNYFFLVIKTLTAFILNNVLYMLLAFKTIFVILYNTKWLKLLLSEITCYYYSILN